MHYNILWDLWTYNFEHKERKAPFAVMGGVFFYSLTKKKFFPLGEFFISKFETQVPKPETYIPKPEMYIPKFEI